MERSYPQPGELAVAAPPLSPQYDLDANLARELWRDAEAGQCGLSLDEFAQVLAAVGTRVHYGQPPGSPLTTSQRTSFLRGLRLQELALAQACALGRDVAWQRFLSQFRAPLLQAAIAISGSATQGHELADSLYGDLFGMKESAGERRSPLTSYTGRGSLMGWLRTTLAQRHVDHHRRTYRETALDTFDAPAPEPLAAPPTGHLSLVVQMLEKTLRSLEPEERYLLASYFLDKRTLQTLASTLRVHEATVSRRLKRLVEQLRARLLTNLQAPPGSLSRRAAEEALGTDPRDLEINLRTILQGSQIAPFSVQGEAAGEEQTA